MAQRTVVWTDTAKLQRRKILEYWNTRNGSTQYSKKLLKFIRARIKQLVKHPFSGKETEVVGTRITSLGHFSIVYQLTTTQLIVIGFWDTRQDPEKLLGSLK
ncbi:MAG: type II toxin-antitoxin system RelE/ParE family toxin [Flavobacteriales bacterium]|nr:type II toxin-antitoxin system RelE/ParE family toxin [Flavobacteriales bacterium]